MSGLLTHSPAQVIRQLLVDLGLGNEITSNTWPVYATVEPDTPDSVITVKGTTGRNHGRNSVTRERDEHYGFQIRVRGQTEPLAETKANTIADTLDTSVYGATVTVDSTDYCVHTVIRENVIPLGRESPTSYRRLYTINCLADIKQI